MPQAHADIQLLLHTRLTSERALALPLARPEELLSKRSVEGGWAGAGG
jgi:hypothetical protein